jgi:hypothetical protein
VNLLNVFHRGDAENAKTTQRKAEISTLALKAVLRILASDNEWDNYKLRRRVRIKKRRAVIKTARLDYLGTGA